MDQRNLVAIACAEIVPGLGRGRLPHDGSSWSTGIADASLPGKDSTWPTCAGRHALRSAHRALRSDHVITIMSAPLFRRARLRWVNDQDTAVQLLNAGPLDTNLADLVTRQAEAQPEGRRARSADAGTAHHDLGRARPPDRRRRRRIVSARTGGGASNRHLSVRTASNSSWPTSPPCAPATSPCRSIRSPQPTNCAQ